MTRTFSFNSCRGCGSQPEFNFLKKIKKVVDKAKMLWYPLEVRSREQTKRTLITEQ